MNTNENNIYTFNQFLSKEFVSFLKDEIKSIVADQKIAKRDRKSDKHPCPEKRVYTPHTAYFRVMDNRSVLHSLYQIYYFIRKNKNTIDWSKVSIEDGWCVYGKYIHIDDSIVEYKSLDEGLRGYYCVPFYDLVVKYLKNNG